MFSSFMTNTWIAATLVALVAGAVGFFVVLRGAAFAAHALPNGAFGGAAGAALLNLSTILGMGIFAVAGAFGISWLGRRGRRDVVTGLALVAMLGLGALFLSWSTQYGPEVYALLFGEVLGVAGTQLAPIGGLAGLCLAAIALLYRPLMLSSVLPEVGEARGVRPARMELAFLLVMALATAMMVPVVGAFLMFSLMTAPAGTARSFTNRPFVALAGSIAIALATMWLAIAASYAWNWPVGFFVGTIGASSYGIARAWAWWASRRGPRATATLRSSH